MMNQPLNDCVIAGPLKNPAPHFAATAFSLLYQSNTLGMKIECHDQHATDDRLSFAFKTPYTSAVISEITGWYDNDQQAVVTENIIQAACGMMSVHGRASGKIQALGLNYVSTLTAALALHGAVAAAIGQLRGLTLSSSRVSMAAAALLSESQYIADATATELPEGLLLDKTAHSAAPPFVSSDGVVFELETLSADPWLKFWTRLGISPALAGKGWTAFLLRYAKAVSPIPSELMHAISKVTYQEISASCSQTGMFICPVRAIDEQVTDEQSKYEWLRGPWTFDSSADVKNIQIKPASSTLPLSGLTVVESCRRIQGPLAGHLLALLGAQVIRIEPPGGDPLRGMPPMSEGCSARFGALNRLKTIREIDIRLPSGQAEVAELVRHADVFLHNWAPNKAAQLNLDYSNFLELNPTLVYAYAAGWSTDENTYSPLHSIPGTDFMVQAYSGVADKISKTCGTQGGSLFTLLDVLGGAIAAQGITIALLNQCMNGVSTKVTSSLLSAATLLCADDFQNQHQAFDIGAASKSVVNGVYVTQQGKIAIECYDHQTTQRLIQALGIAADIEPAKLQQQLCCVLLAKTAEEWVTALQHAQVPAAIVAENLVDLHNNPRLKSILNLNSKSYTQVPSPWSFQ
ncbi:CoA transferase [Nitrosomonas sp. Nm166]|uniref:CoA transferase n=1 Tax=Nitrosomonas sp. Nm166 TaxID=1881054 RepID=UPI0008E7DD30|nr:CoA transferase [Nitrosomonas sp. Nm166]SFE34720.1 Crotonobetainyl-CoA:carnitine CoA-transferase CaiB [Nitrosomonas sp. Nm166]